MLKLPSSKEILPKGPIEGPLVVDLLLVNTNKCPVGAHLLVLTLIFKFLAGNLNISRKALRPSVSKARPSGLAKGKPKVSQGVLGGLSPPNK